MSALSGVKHWRVAAPAFPKCGSECLGVGGVWEPHSVRLTPITEVLKESTVLCCKHRRLSTRFGKPSQISRCFIKRQGQRAEVSLTTSKQKWIPSWGKNLSSEARHQFLNLFLKVNPPTSRNKEQIYKGQLYLGLTHGVRVKARNRPWLFLHPGFTADFCLSR